MSEGYKKCPYCNRVIMGNATECKHCGASLGGGGNGNRNNTQNIDTSDDENYSACPQDTGFSFEKAFTYMFKDPDFGIKYTSLIIAIFVMDVFRETIAIIKGQAAPNPAQTIFDLLALLAIVSVIMGYTSYSVRNTCNSGTNNSILGVSVFSNFITGFICLISNFLALLAIILLILFILFSHQTGLNAFILWSIVIVLTLGYMCYSTAFFWMFSNKRNPLTFFRYVLAGRLIVESGIGRYILSNLCIWAVNIFIGIILGIYNLIVVLSNTNVPMWIILIISSVIVAYGVLVNSYFIGKSINANLVDEL